MTGEGKTDGLLDNTLAAGSVIKEDDVRAPWVDTDSHWNRWKPCRDAVFESSSQLGIWTRRFLLQTVDLPRVMTEM